MVPNRVKHHYRGREQKGKKRKVNPLMPGGNKKVTPGIKGLTFGDLLWVWVVKFALHS